MIAAAVWISHLPLAYVLFFGQLISIFLLLFACWELAEKCFERTASRYAGAALVAALLTLPVAGTALYIMDQYLNPRNVTAFIGVLAIAWVLDRHYLRAGILLILGALIHPLMTVFAASCCIVLALSERLEFGRAAFLLFPLGLFDPTSPAYHNAVSTHTYFYLTQWQWYEWLGAIGPIVIFWWFARIAGSRQMKNLALTSKTLVIYQIFFLIAALILSIPRFESLARLQPMRDLHLVYILLVLFSGCLLQEFVLKDRCWLWLFILLPLCAGMAYAQRSLFPSSRHVEWPWSQPRNAWVQAFEWVRANTPEDAIFALDPRYMHISGEDGNGFRDIAQRSMIADDVTDGGAVTMFPPMADEWLAQSQAHRNWKQFGPEDFRRLKAEYGVNWVVVQQPGVSGLECPYENHAVKVCRLQ
jgi:hypothetical protein